MSKAQPLANSVYRDPMPVLRAMAQRLVWFVWMYEILKPVVPLKRLKRWIVDQLDQIEHGLRCILIIRCANVAHWRKKARQSSRVTMPDLSSHKRTSRREMPGFSFSMAAFKNGPQEFYSRRTSTRMHTSRAESVAVRAKLTARLDALQAVIDALDAYLSRMAHAVRRQGFRFRAFIGRPSNWIIWPETRVRLDDCKVTPPFLDSS